MIKQEIELEYTYANESRHQFIKSKLCAGSQDQKTIMEEARCGSQIIKS